MLGLKGKEGGLARWKHAYKQASANLKGRVTPLSPEQSKRFAVECREQVRRGRAYDSRRVRVRGASRAVREFRAAVVGGSRG